MNKLVGLALLATACVVTVALAGSSFAAFKAPRTAKPASNKSFNTYSPSLIVEQSSYKVGAPFTADLFVAANNTDDPSASVKIFVPAGYGVSLSKPLGTKIGSVAALAQIGALANSTLPLTGDIVIGDPTNSDIMKASGACTGSPTSQGVLILNLALKGQPPTAFPVFVNKTGPFLTFQICVPYPEVSSANPSGVRILLLDAAIKGVFTNPAASNPSEWAALFTPYDPTTKTPVLTSTIESRTFVPLGAKLTLAKVKAKRGFKLAGKLTLPGIDLGQSSVHLDLFAGKKQGPAPTATSSGTGKRVGRTAKLPRAGTYSVTRRSVKVTTYFQTRFQNYTTSCDPPSPIGSPFPCKGEYIAAVTSNQVKVLKPKPKKHK